jgi:ubiquinone/menaquinone biosynthesis C-methylase UbiE
MTQLRDHSHTLCVQADEPVGPCPFVDPKTGDPLVLDGDVYRSIKSGEVIAHIHEGGVVDFVNNNALYTSSFSFQWLRTAAIRSVHPQLRANHKREMDLRTGFATKDLRGKRCLEIGAGLGEDTDYMLGLGISEIYAVDLSESIYRASELIDDPRAHFVRGDASSLPFTLGSFDIVLCHRVIQHTPHPAATLARAAAMVKPGGILFTHSYHRSTYFNASAKYKYRWLTTKIPSRMFWAMLAVSSPLLRGSAKLCARLCGQRGVEFTRRWNPWVVLAPQHLEGVDRKTRNAKELQVAFDSLTPKYDIPMYSQDFVDLIEGFGFRIENIERRPWYPLWATATRTDRAREFECD